ncbi:SAM-dependent methyltransferase [Rhabdothermincola sediminis]|uniref:SAM-dependent methyltransferase n=1 Tax=Rhabdothermincola sediminis TaxID=2751370 RepID=UPI001AA04464|nr:SAM-dependent methyltransferase [Rhabdothermincola sediminis]
MHKSSIYLPDDLKQALSQRASAAGRSEADLIRHAITLLLSRDQPAPGTPADSDPASLALPRPGLVGVGVGPGDPSLITRRAVAVLAEADRVVTVSTDARSIGRAEAVVRSTVPLAAIQRVAFDLDPQARGRSMSELVGAVSAALDVGELVAVAVLGDPAQWTVFPDLVQRIRPARPAVPIVAVPGITAYQAAAAEAAIALGGGGGSLVVTADPRRAADAARAGDAVVLHKADTTGEVVRTLAEETGRDDALLAELTGLPGERMVPARSAPDGPIAYLSAVIVPALAGAATGR